MAEMKPVAWLFPVEPSEDWPWEYAFIKNDPSELSRAMGAFPVFASPAAYQLAQARREEGERIIAAATNRAAARAILMEDLIAIVRALPDEAEQ